MHMPLVLTNRRRRGGSASAFSPSSLYSSGSQGIWLDPSDLSTMFSDRAGTTAVTAPGTVVGLRLDKSKGGVGTNGASRRNLLTYSEQFDVTAGGWAKEASTAPSSTGTSAPFGTSAVNLLTDNATSARHIVYQSFSGTLSDSRTLSVYAKQNTLRYLVLSVTNQGDTNCYSAVFDLQVGSVSATKVNGTATITANAPVAVGGGWYRCSISGTMGASSGNFYPFIGTSDRADFSGALAQNNMPVYAGSSQSLYLWGAQLELGTTASAYQKITADWASTMAGNHATAPTDAARPIYGVEPKGGRRNLLTWTEQMDNGVWTKTAATVTANTDVAPDGTTTADKLVENATTNQHFLQVSISATSGVVSGFSVYAKAAERGFVILSMGGSPFSGAAANEVWFNLATGAVGTNTGPSDFATITPVGNGWYRCFIGELAIATGAALGYIKVSATNGANSYAGDGTSGILIWGAQLELGSTATNYQRVTTAYDITESGVATCHYVQYDGSDDSMSTAAIDFTATDKMSVFAGVRKLSDAAAGVFVEYSTNSETTNGSFSVFAPSSATLFLMASRGNNFTAASTTNAIYAAPVSVVLTGLENISGDRNTLRINGTQVAQTTTDQGTGNYGNYPLFFGRRNNTSNPFNGKDYGIIVVGKAASAGEISDTELWLSDKTAEVDVAKSISPNIYTRSGDTILDRANSIIERRTV